jgi:23S rRNA pseudouridine2605 synthase
LIAVGRLDWATSGLLLLTNDTRLANWLTDPGSAVCRTYLVTVRGKVTEESLERLRKGLLDAGEKLQPEEIILRKASGRESHLTVRLAEGKNREIRRMFSAISHEVTRLKRVAFGALELGELEPEKYRELTRGELERAFPGVQSLTR